MPAAQCGNCKEELPDDRQTPEENRTPCPKCGSTKRLYEVIADATFVIAWDDYTGALLTFAESLIEQKQYGTATVVAHVACEINVEKAFTRAFATNGVPQIQSAVVAFLSGFNLGNDRIRDLYNALTGRDVHMQPFWEAFTHSATRRSKFIHNGKPVIQAEAQASIVAARAMINYLA